MADISFNIACKELKIAQIAQLNQLFQLLHLVHIYGHGFYELSRMLMRKNLNNVGTLVLLCVAMMDHGFWNDMFKSHLGRGRRRW